jgi:acyl-[acyl-carrier-protein]-phospholipid O-acyltransferase/long-chain-fatty-acid--[acyl-carrier-protein] ligase
MYDLITSRRFGPLFACQFLSALNDNFVKNVLVFMVVFTLATTHGAAMVTLAGAVFIAPFFLFSALGGQLADKFDKARVARWLKLAEIAIAAIAALGFALQSVPVLMTALGLTGLLSALFGPIKYGILPDLLKTAELTAGNALIESATFVAILLGTLAGGLAASLVSVWVVAALMIAIATAAWGFSWLIPTSGRSTPAIVVDRNPLVSTGRLLAAQWQDRRLWNGSVIVSWFWVVGAVMLSVLPPMVKDVLGGTQQLVTACLVIFVVGIAAGSLLAARASKLRPNLGVVPLGALLMGLFGLDLGWMVGEAVREPLTLATADLLTTWHGFRFMADLFGLAAAGGLFIVPSFAAVQAWAPPERRARVVATTNIISAAFMATAGLLLAAIQWAGIGFHVLLTFLGAVNLVVAVLVLRYWGRETIRDLATLLFGLIYRVEVRGQENLPAPGTRMIIAPNHVSLLDGPLIHCFLPLDAVFAIDTGFTRKAWMKPLLWGLPHHPIDPTRPLAARQLIAAIKAGEPLVIFPEGRITVTGQLMKIYDGTAMMADKADALVVPVRIEGAERSTLSYLVQGQIRKALFPRIRLTIQKPVRLTIAAEMRGKHRRRAAGAGLQDIMTEMAVRSMIGDKTLFEALSDAMGTRDTGKPIVLDPLGIALTYRRLIRSAQVLGGKLIAITAEGEAVGVMLPNSAGVAVVFFALQSIGRVPAMLNFTAGSANVLSACTAAEVKTVLTSRTFVEKAKLDALTATLAAEKKIVYLEDVRAAITLTDKIAGVLRGSEPMVVRNADDPAVILFTSGSEGTPKGVVLSHRNIVANAAQALARVDANGEDKVFNVLPVFHSFGLTGGLVMPLMAGVPVFLYPSPLHYRIVPELIYQTNATILFGTDTFLAGYARAAHPYDFRSLRLILAGAEPVKPQTRTAYMEQFGVRILEGYGVTETAPVLAMNTPIANRPGTVGRLSPLMEAKLEPVPGVAEGGRLSVRGPNVMLGYLRAENPGVIEPPPGGWHDTGDIVTIDSDGFITIKGRAKRFAKIAGEMVSLAAAETLAQHVWPDAHSAVVALPDARKGERLALVTTQAGANREVLSKAARAQGISELAVPARIVTTARLPVLGSGKTDYVAVMALAEGGAEAAAD